MKKLFPFLGLLVATLITSCEAEQINEAESSENLEISTKATSLGGDSSGDTAAELFERRMEWLSFLTVKVMDEQTSTKAYINGLMTANNTVQASALFGHSPYTSFEAEFRDLLYDELSGTIPDPDHDRDKPGVPIIPIPDPLTGDVYEIAVQDFIDYIVTDNCVELYFPNGAIVGNSGGIGFSFTSFTSTAHPLNSDASNAGIKRLERIAPAPLRGYTTDVTVNDGYVNINDNVVVARPKTTIACPYTEYGTLDFTLFLD